MISINLPPRCQCEQCRAHDEAELERLSGKTFGRDLARKIGAELLKKFPVQTGRTEDL